MRLDPHGHGPGSISSRIDYIFLSVAQLLNVRKVWIDGAAGFALQLARVLAWRDHAPVCCWISYRCLFDHPHENLQHEVTRAHVRTLESSEDVQRDLRDMIDQRCREPAPILQELWKEPSVDSYWQWVNWCVRDAMQ